MIRRTLDLPAPFGPTTPIFAPGRKASVTSSRTTLSPWALRTLRMEKTYWAIHPAYGSGRSPMPWRPAPAAGARAAYRSGRGRRRRLPQFGAKRVHRVAGHGLPAARRGRRAATQRLGPGVRCTGRRAGGADQLRRTTVEVRPDGQRLHFQHLSLIHISEPTRPY